MYVPSKHLLTLVNFATAQFVGHPPSKKTGGVQPSRMLHGAQYLPDSVMFSVDGSMGMQRSGWIISKQGFFRLQLQKKKGFQPAEIVDKLAEFLHFVCFQLFS